MLNDRNDLQPAATDGHAFGWKILELVFGRVEGVAVLDRFHEMQALGSVIDEVGYLKVFGDWTFVFAFTTENHFVLACDEVGDEVVVFQVLQISLSALVIVYSGDDVDAVEEEHLELTERLPNTGNHLC